MTEAQIRQIVRDEMSNSQTQYINHAHTGVDSQRIESKYINTATGFIFRTKLGTARLQITSQGNLQFIGESSPMAYYVTFDNIFITSGHTDTSYHIEIVRPNSALTGYVGLLVEDGAVSMRSQTYSTVYITDIAVGDEILIVSSTSPDFRVQIPNLGATPATCVPGEFCISGGKLYICETANNWVIK